MKPNRTVELGMSHLLLGNWADNFGGQNVRKQILRDYNAKLNSEPSGTTRACPVLGTALANFGSNVSMKEPLIASTALSSTAIAS